MSLAYLQQESTSLHNDAIWALRWTAKNQVISGSADGHLRIFDPTSLPSAPLHDLAPHGLSITSLSTNASGSQVLSASLDGSVVLTDVSDGQVLGKVDTSREKLSEGSASEIPAYTAALHPQGKCWAWSGRSSKLAIRSIVEAEMNGNEGAENGDSVSAGRALSGGDTKAIDTGKGKFGMDIQFSPDGRSLALATETGHIIVVDTESQAVVATYTSHAMAVRTLSWSADSQWLFSGSDDHRIVLHDVRAGSTTGATGKGEGAVAVMQGHQSWVLSVDSGPDGKLLGSGGADNTVKLWDVGQRTCVSTTPTLAPAWGFAWQPVPAETFAAGKQFVVAGDDRAVTLYRAAGAA